jgi:hypothetical protein
MKLKHLAAVAALLALSGPVWAESMSVSSVRDFIGQFQNVIDDAHTQAGRASEIYHGALSASSTPSNPVYPALATEVAAVKAAEAGLDAPASKVEALGARFTALAQGHDSISSDQPEWKEAQGIIDQLKSMQGPLQDAAKPLSKALQHFAEVASKGGVGQLDISGIRAQLKAWNEKMPGWLEEGQSVIGRAKAQAADPDAGPERKERLRDLLGKFEPVFADVKAQWPTYKAMATKAMYTPAGNEIHYFMGPGTTQPPIVDQLHEATQSLHQKVERFKDLRDKLKG